MIGMDYNYARVYCPRTGSYIGLPGDRLEVDHFWGTHVGTLNWNGEIWACSRKFNGVRLVSIDNFSDGKKIRNVGNVGSRARERIIQTYEFLESDGYDVASKNCEHIDNFCRGLNYTSPQINNLYFALGITLISVAFAASARK